MLFKANRLSRGHFGESENQATSGSIVSGNEDPVCEVAFEWKDAVEGDFASVESASPEEVLLEQVAEVQSEKTKLKSQGKTVLFGLAVVFVLASLMGNE